MSQNHEPSGYWAGVELGGTKIRAGICSGNLKLHRKIKLSTKAERGPASVIERIARAVTDAADEADVTVKDLCAVGVGAPGTVDMERGEVVFSPNLNWQEVPLRKQLEKALGIPVFVDNDGSVASLGVHLVELKSRPANMLGLFVGSRISGGLIVNGEPFRGINHSAGELGHMVIAVGGPKCGCGTRGCLEALASRTAIFQQIRGAVKEGEKTALTDLLKDDLRNLRCSDLRQAVRLGDKLVETTVKEAARHLGIAVGNLINLLNPEVVVLGGGVIDALADKMLPVIQETAADYVMPGTFNGIKIQLSTLGDTAGIIGGAALARRMAN